MNFQHAWLNCLVVLTWLWMVTMGLKNNQQTVTDRTQLVEHDNDVSSSSELKRKQPGIHQRHLHSLEPVPTRSLQQGVGSKIVDVTVTAREAFSNGNLTVYDTQIKKFWSLQKLRVQGQYAYISIVFLMCLILAGIQCMGGFQVRHNTETSVSMNDKPHTLSVYEVLLIKAHYLRIIHQNCELKEVFVHDCGNDP